MKILPIHPRMIDGEVLSSWMVRLAISNGYNLHTFYRHVLGLKLDVWNRDIDAHCSKELIDILSDFTMIPRQEIWNTTLKVYEGFLFGAISQSETSFVLSRGIKHRTHSRRGMQFCPMCLSQDYFPNYKVHWRLACICVCYKHQCLLRDCCMNCGSPVSFHRHAIGGKLTFPECHLNECFNCHANLADQGTIALQNLVSKDIVILYVNFIKSIEFRDINLCLKWNRSDESFFKLYRLIASYLFTRVGFSIFKIFSEKIGINTMERIKGDFEYKSIENRLSINLVVIAILKEWATNGNNTIGRNDLKFLDTLFNKI